MSYYDGDDWANHTPNWIDCAECGEQWDDQEDEGNICPDCVEEGNK